MANSEKKLLHPPYNKLKGYLREKGVTYEDLAIMLGLTVSTVSMKINGHSDFYLNETKILRDNLTPPTDIFT